MPSSGTRTVSRIERTSEAAGGRPEQRFVNFDGSCQVDVRKEIARIAGVSVGNVTKVKTTDHDPAFGHYQSAGRRSFPFIEPGYGASYRPKSSRKSYGSNLREECSKQLTVLCDVHH
jgi:hypothetical protein